MLLLGNVIRGIRYKKSAAIGGSSQGESHYIITGGTPQDAVIGAYATKGRRTGRKPDFSFTVHAAVQVSGGMLNGAT